MAKIRNKKVEESAIDMTPMIDVIFQLMIFFMCTIKFKALDGKLMSYLPKDRGLKPDIITQPPLDEVRIKLLYDNASPLATKIILTSTIGPELRMKNMEALKDNIQEGYNKQQKLNLKLPHIIDAEPNIPVQMVVSTLDACRQAGVADVTLAVKLPVDNPLSK